MLDSLSAMLVGGENTNVEFKKSATEVTKDVYETVCSFSNRSGGDIFLGVKDNGVVLGIDRLSADRIKKDFVTAVNNPQKMNPPLYLQVEDIEYNVKFFENISSLNILEDRLYHYVQHVGQRLTNKKIDNYFDLQKQRIELVKEQQKRWDLYETTKVKEILALIYFRSLFSAIERWFVDYNKSQIKKKLKEEYNSSLYNELRKYCKPKQIFSKFLYFPCKSKNITLTIVYAKIIHIVKTKFQFLFSRLKQIRK